MWTLRAVLLTLISTVLAAPLEESLKITANVAEPIIYEYNPNANPPEGEGRIIGDIRRSTNRNALSTSDIKWPNGVIPYVINSQYSSQIQDTIRAAMTEIEQDVNGPADCVKFTPRTDEVNYIEVYPGTGCHTDVGWTNSGRELVSIGPGCESRGTILHELVHVLGFSHEHSRTDRDRYININMTNVNTNETENFLMEADINTFNTTYDFSSIEHYRPYTHALDETVPVITPKDGLAVGIKLGQRMGLSDIDVLRIQRMYSCQEDGVLRCNFENNLCNFTQNGTFQFQWTVMRGESGGGPRAGNTNGAGDAFDKCGHIFSGQGSKSIQELALESSPKKMLLRNVETIQFIPNGDAYLVAKGQGQIGAARIVTPFMTVGSICVDFYLFQRGPSSYLNVVAWGPRIARTVIASYQEKNVNKWVAAQIIVNVPVGVRFKVAFEANLNSGDVAIDDVNIYKGACL